mmetsp:Transcript_6025/g.9822  ORF Transcript_6025/g.9822 Transcript_6025/m.9822 type:complete len:699 (+) Transcript_6025:194-2290(+)
MGVSGEALAQTGVGVAVTAVGALLGPGSAGGREELVGGGIGEMTKVDAHVQHNLGSGLEVGVSADRNLVDGVDVVVLGVLLLLGSGVHINSGVHSSHVEEHHAVALVQALVLSRDDVHLVVGIHGLAVLGQLVKRAADLLVVHVSGEQIVGGEGRVQADLQKHAGGGENVVFSGGGDLGRGGTGKTEQTESQVGVPDHGQVETGGRVVVAPIGGVGPGIVGGGGVTDTSVDVLVSALHQLDEMRVLDAALVPVVDLIRLGRNDAGSAGVGGRGGAQTSVAVGVSEASLEELSLSSGEAIQNPALVDNIVKGSQHALTMVRHVVIELAVETIGEHKALQTGGGFLSVQRSTVAIQENVKLGLLQDTNIGREHEGHSSQEMNIVGSALGEGGEVIGKDGDVGGSYQLVQALDGVGSDNVIGKGLEGSNNGVAVGIVGNSLSAPVLSEHIVEHDGETAVEVGKESIGRTIRGESNCPIGHATAVDTVVQVQRVSSVLASAQGAVGTVVASVTLATKGHILIPQLVDVTVVVPGDLLDGVAHTVAGAIAGARGSLASRTLVALKALASTTSAVAKSLVGALHVVMGSVRQLVAGRVHHIGELLGGSVGVHLGVHNDSGAGASQLARGGIQISLGSINVGKAELAHSLGAVVGHPVAVAHAHVVVGAHTMGAASIGALSVGEAEDASSEENSGSDLVEHLKSR